MCDCECPCHCSCAPWRVWFLYALAYCIALLRLSADGAKMIRLACWLERHEMAVEKVMERYMIEFMKQYGIVAKWWYFRTEHTREDLVAIYAS